MIRAKFGRRGFAMIRTLIGCHDSRSEASDDVWALPACFRQSRNHDGKATMMWASPTRHPGSARTS
jgi:hypothetical protein